jgi:hypothetical protein
MTTNTTPIDLLNTLRHEIRDGEHDAIITPLDDEAATTEMLVLLEQRLGDWAWDLADLGYNRYRTVMNAIQDRIEAIMA